MFMAKVKKLNRKGNRGKVAEVKRGEGARGRGVGLEGIVKKFKESDK